MCTQPPLTILLLLHLLLPTQSIQCQSWFPSTLITLTEDQINDGYCDCPFDGSDEVHTGACSGSRLWAGVAAGGGGGDGGSSEEGGEGGGDISVGVSGVGGKGGGGGATFTCPQQPTLHLPPSRLNDGICDCCDGADESTTTACPDICDKVLAEERAARAKLIENYEVGSKIRYDSIAQYEKWMGEMQNKLHEKEVELSRVGEERNALDVEVRGQKIGFGRQWWYVIGEVLPTLDVMGLVGKGDEESMSVDDLASLIISLCWMSGEVSNDLVANGRCVAFDRGSVDVGILWEKDGAEDESKLPKFHYLDAGDDELLLEYAERVIGMAQGKDTDMWSKKNQNKSRSKPKRRRKEPEYYDDDMMADDYDYEDEIDEAEDKKVPEKELTEEEKAQEAVDKLVEEKLIKESVPARLKKLHLTRTRDLFKEQADMLLKLNPPADKSEDEDADEEESPADESADNNADEENGSKIDPIAINMAKSTINKRMSNIHRGEASAKFAARHVVSLMKNHGTSNRSISNVMQMLAIRMIYHSQISVNDVAEVIYTTSSALSPNFLQEVDPSTCPATSPWSDMCPPKSFSVPSGTFPPNYILNAAIELCQERSNAMEGVCTPQHDLQVEDFPTTIHEGYYNYYSPKQREESDPINNAFNEATQLLILPPQLSKLIDQSNTLNDQIETIQEETHSLKREMDTEDKTKFGFQGELFTLRNTCHTIESGKYTYEVCINGKASQRDLGQKVGGTHLGSWQTMQMSDDGQRLMKWTGGTKCWNGPNRSAEVSVSCGSETRLLSADEPETCRYVFRMESPVGCDLFYRERNNL